MRLIRLLKDDIAKESAEWVAEELITQEQAEKICRKYGIAYDNGKGSSLGYHILVNLGYLFVGLAVIVLIGANWDEIPRALRMWCLILITLATQGIAVRKYREGRINTAVGLFFLGNLFFGASIVLIAQIYHLGEHMPDGIFWWAIGCLPIALATGNSWLMLQSLLLSLIWFYLEADLGFYPLSFPLFIAGAIAVLIRSDQNHPLFLFVTGSIGLWLESTLALLWQKNGSLEISPEHYAIGAAYTIFVYASGYWLRSRESHKAQDYGVLLDVWGLRFGLASLLILSFAYPWKCLLNNQWNHLPTMGPIVGLFIGGAVWLAFRFRAPSSIPFIALVFVSAVIAVVAIQDGRYATAFQAADNLVAVVMGIWLIIRGTRSGISHYFFLGIASILLIAFLRYIDLIGSYVGGTILFGFMAAVLFGAATFWRRVQRKKGTA